MLMQSVHICAAIILCITHHCLSSENQTDSDNVKSESNDLKAIFNLDGNVTKSLDKANPAEDHTKAQRNTSDGEQMNKETYGVKPGEFIINRRVEGSKFKPFFKNVLLYGVITLPPPS